MKTKLPLTLVLSLFALLGLNQKSVAQACSVKNLLIKVNNITSTPTSCVVNADISWIQDANFGNKYSNVHIWSSSNYPSPVLSYAKPPTAAELANAIGTLVIKDPSSATPTLNATYPPASGVRMVGITAGTVLTRTANSPSTGLDSFHVSNVNLTLSGTNSCSQNFILKADVWSSQSNSDQTVQCANANGTFTTPDVQIGGSILCLSPRKFQLLISTTYTSTVTFTYSVYADTDNSGGYSESDPIIYSGNGNAISGTPYNSGLIPYTDYPTNNLSVVVFVTGNPIAATGLLTNGCSLPVKYKSFEATRESASLVTLKWTTAMEQINTGFEIQRKDGNGIFKAIAFVNSKTKDGSSWTELSYVYKDQNSFEGMSQYRIAQVDQDGKRTFSTIAVVNGKQSIGTTILIYPNPAVNGTTMAVFNNSDQKDIILTDMSGKVIKTASNLSTNNYQLTGLKSGMYILKVVNLRKNEIVIEKISVR